MKKRTSMIDEKLTKLLKEFDKMLGKPEEDEDILDKLVHSGLTPNEAEAWLKSEPNFVPSDDSYHEPSNRRRVTRTPLFVVWTCIRIRLMRLF